MEQKFVMIRTQPTQMDVIQSVEQSKMVGVVPLLLEESQFVQQFVVLLIHMLLELILALIMTETMETDVIQIVSKNSAGSVQL